MTLPIGRGVIRGIESADGRVCGFGRDGDQQATGSLRVEEQVAILLRNALRETDAIANEIAIILQSAGKKASAGRCDGAWEVGNSRMLDLQGNSFDSLFGTP